MSDTPARLCLLGFVNPTGHLPSFLVPVFGTDPALWVQDSSGNGLVSRFFPCGAAHDKTITHSKSRVFQNIGEPLIYAFQFGGRDEVQFGNRAFVENLLRDNLDRFDGSPFLRIEVLNFIGDLVGLPGAIEQAAAKLSTINPSIAANWQASQSSTAGFAAPAIHAVPLQCAEMMFQESLIALMAPSVRAITNHFARHGIDLDLLIVADMADRIQLMPPRQGTTSILLTRLKKSTSAGRRDRVQATIFIHKDANRALAKVCIAYELYHLLLELAAYIKARRAHWAGVHPNKQIEDDCNVFAWQLCKFRDALNRDEGLRQAFLYFPEHLFDSPLRIESIQAQLEWPAGISLDPNDPFHARPDLGSRFKTSR